MSKYKISELADEISIRENNPKNSDYDKFVGLEHYDSGNILIKRYGTTEKLDSAMKVFKNDDILIARRNVYLKRASMVKFDGLTSGDSIVLRAKNESVKRLLPFVFNTESFWNYAISHADGSMSKRLSPALLMEYETNLPDNDKDRDKLADVLWSINDTLDSYKEQLRLCDELVKAQFVEMFGDILDKPKHEMIKLGDICSTISGGTPSTKHPEFYNGDIPWITTVQLGDNFINRDNAKSYITEEAICNSATHLIDENNILFGTRVGVGKSSINTDKMCTNQDINAIIIIDKKQWELLFIKYVLDQYQPYFDTIKKGATILGITTEDLKSVGIPKVGKIIQSQFVEFVNHLDKSKVALKDSIELLNKIYTNIINNNLG